MSKARVTKRRAAVADLRKQGQSLRAIAGALGVSLGTVQRDVAALHNSINPQVSEDSQVDALGLLERAASGGNVQAIRDLRKEQYVPPCVDHITRSEHENALEEVFAIVEQNVVPVASLAKYDDFADDLRAVLIDTALGVRRTYEGRETVRRHLSGEVEAESAPVSEPYSHDDLARLAVMIFTAIQKRVLAIPYVEGFEGVRDALDHHCRESLESAKAELEASLSTKGIE